MPKGLRNNPYQINELTITLDELHFLMDCVEDYRKSPIYGDLASRLADHLLALWSYWSERTNDTARFTLRIKK